MSMCFDNRTAWLMSYLVNATRGPVLPRNAIELVERGRPVQGCLVLVVDALGHILEPRQDEALLRRRSVDPAPNEVLWHLRGFVRDHLHPRRRFRVPFRILRCEVLVHVDPFVSVAVSHEHAKVHITAQTSVSEMLCFNNLFQDVASHHPHKVCHCYHRYTKV